MQSDLVIVGGGPAGLSAGICLAKYGHSVVVLERTASVPDGPGETFHPGIEPIFDQLGIGDQMRAVAIARHEEILVDLGNSTERVAYGSAWRGFQIRRRSLNQSLADKFRQLGGVIQFATAALGLHRDGACHLVETAQYTIRSKWLIDASGNTGWLDRCQGTEMNFASPRIWLQYGYETNGTKHSVVPRLTVREKYWLWHAPLGDGETTWVEGALQRPARRHPAAKITDGTWQLSPAPAGDRLFRIGDAACRLDPRNGHGVLRALMSGLMASHLIKATESGEVEMGLAIRCYNRWIDHWFHFDAGRLRLFGWQNLAT